MLNSEERKLEEKEKEMLRHKAKANWLLITVAIIFIVTIILIIPIFTETGIHIQIGYADNILTVSVDTPSKPLASHLFPPSYPVGAYTVNITITTNATVVFNVSRSNIPIGEYILVWQSGVPSHGLYTIRVELYSLGILRDTYTINVSF
jgi:hypothetical protein